ncbi:MAG: hypothetical protein IT431_18330, partial [Phycisphaerales bacterium]|nr:hypothetical protein [Phycisphaerales bacterium]
MDLARLVDLAAARLKLNIDYDTKLTGTVTLRLNGPVSDTELWQLTNRMLAARGFTTVRMGEENALSVVSLSAAPSLAKVESPDAPAAALAGFRAVLVPVRTRRLEDVIAALEPMLSSTGKITPVAESRSVLVADLSLRVEAALRAIGALEAGAPALSPTEIPLANLPASRLVTLLGELSTKRAAAGAAPLRGEVLAGVDDRSLLVVAPTDEIDRWRELVGQLDTHSTVETTTYSPGAFSLFQVAASVERLVGGDERFRVVADDLTGTLQVTASAEQHEQVRSLLDRLAAAPEAARRPTRTFTLQNRDAEEVLGVVQSLVTAGLTRPATTMTEDRTTAAPRDPSPTATAPDQLQLTADPATNAIIAIGEVQELDRLARLIDDLDVRRPQVLLEVLIVSLSESDSLDLGVEMEKLILGPGDTIAKLSSLFGLSSTGAASGGIADRSTGGSAIVLSPGDFSVVLKALQSINRGRSLSMPKVLVASNEQATINSVLETPYTTINASDTVATTASGGSSNAGTEVSVTPQIAEGDHLRLEYQVSLSAFVGEAADPSV